jgi:hypothetical protein
MGPVIPKLVGILFSSAIPRHVGQIIGDLQSDLLKWEGKGGRRCRHLEGPVPSKAVVFPSPGKRELINCL